MLLNCGVGEDSFECPSDCKEIKPANPKGNQSWIFIGMTDAEAETPLLWPPDEKNQLIGEDPDARKDWRWEKGITKDEMFGWHHQHDGHEIESTPGVGDGQRTLVCCGPWGHKKSDITEQVNWTDDIDTCKTFSNFQYSPDHDNPLQSSCLGNPMDRGACQAVTVHGVTKSQTRLKWLNHYAQL